VRSTSSPACASQLENRIPMNGSIISIKLARTPLHPSSSKRGQLVTEHSHIPHSLPILFQVYSHDIPMIFPWYSHEHTPCFDHGRHGKTTTCRPPSLPKALRGRFLQAAGQRGRSVLADVRNAASGVPGCGGYVRIDKKSQKWYGW
jgi:hypothetical protein